MSVEKFRDWKPQYSELRRLLAEAKLTADLFYGKARVLQQKLDRVRAGRRPKSRR